MRLGGPVRLGGQVPTDRPANKTNLKKANYTLPDITITLKNINNPLAIPMLKPLLTTEKPRLKLAAAEILIHLGDTSGANLLLSQKEDENLRLATALLLSDEHLESILPILKNGLNHREAKTRLKIINKLADLGQTNFIISTKDKFLLLLDMLEQEPNAWERGTDLFLKEIPKPADEIIEMIGHPDGYDPSGTTKLRQAVIDRWRRRLNTEGIKWLKGLNPPQIITGNQRATIGKIEFSNQDIDMGNHFCFSCPRHHRKDLAEVSAHHKCTRVLEEAAAGATSSRRSCE